MSYESIIGISEESDDRLTATEESVGINLIETNNRHNLSEHDVSEEENGNNNLAQVSSFEDACSSVIEEICEKCANTIPSARDKEFRTSSPIKEDNIYNILQFNVNEDEYKIKKLVSTFSLDASFSNSIEEIVIEDDEEDEVLEENDNFDKQDLLLDEYERDYFCPRRMFTCTQDWKKVRQGTSASSDVASADVASADVASPDVASADVGSPNVKKSINISPKKNFKDMVAELSEDVSNIINSLYYYKALEHEEPIIRTFKGLQINTNYVNRPEHEEKRKSNIKSKGTYCPWSGYGLQELREFERQAYQRRMEEAFGVLHKLKIKCIAINKMADNLPSPTVCVPKLKRSLSF